MRVIVILLIAVALASCSRIAGEDALIRNRSNDYQKSKSVPALKIPADLSSDAIQDYYPVPEGKRCCKPDDLLPPGSLAEQIKKQDS